MKNNQLLELVQICKGDTISSMSLAKGRQERVSELSMENRSSFKNENDETEATGSSPTIAGTADKTSGCCLLFFSAVPLPPL